jgi:chitin disaccharide deacetylase
MKNLTKVIIIFLFFFNTYAQQTGSDEKILLIRCDDLGMSHSVNMAAKELINSGLIFSASIMFPCAWYQEAVDILKDHPQITAGIHLTLNSEWKNYRWGPIAGRDKVPSLVDKNGYFFPSRAAFFANNPKPEEVEIELRAQIERAINSGLKITYMDYHMGTAVDTPELRKIVEKLGDEYGLGISRYYNEVDLESMYKIPIENKTDFLLNSMTKLPADTINLLVCHVGIDNDELSAMIDMNSFGLPDMSKHREAELKALLNAMRENIFEKNNIRLINYKDLINNTSLVK